jgi:hypothetical protein
VNDALDKELERALLARLRERAATLLTGQSQVLALLADAEQQINTLLAGQPADWQRWQLGRLKEQISAILDAATSRASTPLDLAVRAAWQQGEDFVDKPLAAVGLNLELQLPILDVTLLASLRSFGTERLADVGSEAAAKISRSLGLVTIGAQTPFEAIKDISGILGTVSKKRAATIVRTQVSQAFGIAQQQRLEQAATLMADNPAYPGQRLQKQWRRSGKIHSRWNHDAIDGQIVDAGAKFKLPSESGPVMMLHPHDPAAPAEEVINCGCVALPYVKRWQVATPGAKPFTTLELQNDARKAQLDQAAQRAGLRAV